MGPPGRSRSVLPTLDELLHRWPVVVFDLDNTLYDESTFLSLADGAIARRLASDGIADEQVVARTLAEERSVGGRKQLFERVIDRLGLPPGTLETMLEMMRNVESAQGLNLHPWVANCFQALREAGRRLFVLTNGNVVQQRNKIRLLGIASLSPELEVIFASEHAAKPAPDGLLEIARRTGAEPAAILFVGDDQVDASAAAAAGCWYAGEADVAALFRA